MSDLISRRAVIDAVCGRCGFYSDDTCGDPKDGKGWQCEDVRAINALPSADRPKGKWERLDLENYKALCSNCKSWSPIISDFCPCCGADMRGGAE